MKYGMIKGIAIGMVAGAGIGMALNTQMNKKNKAVSKSAKYIGNVIDSLGDIFGF